MQHDPASSNPFAHRPMSALGGKKIGGDVMVELDHASNMPEGVDRAAWDHFVKARRRKVDSEQKVSTTLRNPLIAWLPWQQEQATIWLPFHYCLCNLPVAHSAHLWPFL